MTHTETQLYIYIYIYIYIYMRVAPNRLHTDIHIGQHTSAYVSIRQHTSAYVAPNRLHRYTYR